MGEVCVIGPYARTRPGTVLGKDVHLGNFVEVKNSIIADHSKANHLAYVGDADIGQQGQHRRRYHHLQLRWRQQVPHHHRGRRLHRLRHAARRPGARRPRRHAGRRHHADQGCAGRSAHRVPCQADFRVTLEAPGQGQPR
jgi:hypothetical protein